MSGGRLFVRACSINLELGLWVTRNIQEEQVTLRFQFPVNGPKRDCVIVRLTREKSRIESVHEKNDESILRDCDYHYRAVIVSV